jgi:hypothetical protein
MPFYIYRHEVNQYCHLDLKGEIPLWGKSGVVAACSEQGGGEKWSVTSSQLLEGLVRKMWLAEDPSKLALIDDLVPRGPETRYAEIVRIDGFLEKGYNPFVERGYNPLLFTFNVVLYEKGPPGAKAEKKNREPRPVLPVRSAHERVRSFGYLYKNWRSRGFSGALLWDNHWRYLTSREQDAEMLP